MLISLKNTLNSKRGNNPFCLYHSLIPDLTTIKDLCSGANARDRARWPSHCWVLFVSVTIVTAVLWPASSRSVLGGGKELKGCWLALMSNRHRVEVTLPFESVTSKCMWDSACVRSGMLPYKGILNKLAWINSYQLISLAGCFLVCSYQEVVVLCGITQHEHNTHIWFMLLDSGIMSIIISFSV